MCFTLVPSTATIFGRVDRAKSQHTHLAAGVASTVSKLRGGGQIFGNMGGWVGTALIQARSRCLFVVGRGMEKPSENRCFGRLLLY